jgi:hypothetical protein
MAWTLPDRIETQAAQWITATNQSDRHRKLSWWARLSSDQGTETSADQIEREIKALVTAVELRRVGSVFGFAAPARGGDKEIARYVQEAAQLPALSFGTWLKKRALGEQRPATRRVLQGLGQRIIDERGALALCLEVLQELPEHLPEQPFLIEGIRHHDVMESLRFLVGPDRFKLLYVDRPEAERRKLLRVEENLSEAEVQQVLDDPTEEEVPDLKAYAVRQLDGMRSREEGDRIIEQLAL